MSLALLVVAIGVFLWSGATARQLPDGWRDAARREGLLFSTVSCCEGRVDGRHVAIHPPLRGQPWSVVVALGFLVPSHFRIEVHHGRVRATPMATPLAVQIEADLLRLAEAGWIVRVGQVATLTSLAVPPEPARLRQVIEVGLQLADVLDQARRDVISGPLRRQGSRLRWMRDRIRAVLSGVHVQVWLPRVYQDGWLIRLEARLSHPLPRDTELMAAGPIGGEDVEVGDLILDKALHITTSDPSALQARIAHDDVRGPLLDLICTWPGSRVSTLRVVHVVKSLDLLPALDRMVELALLLDQAAARTR